MISPPETLDGAFVLRVADLSQSEHTGKTRRYAGGEQLEGLAHLAIVQYHDGGSHHQYHLFSCDQDWNVVTHTLHASVTDAITQAEFEYGHVVFGPVAGAQPS